MGNFIYFKSSKYKRADDCVVRSLMVAEGCTWEQAFNKLCHFSLQCQDIPNSTRVIEKTLKDMDYEFIKAPFLEPIKGLSKRRLKVWEFAEQNPKGTFILSVSGHLVCVHNGNWYDSWDSCDCKVLKIYKRKE